MRGIINEYNIFSYNKRANMITIVSLNKKYLFIRKDQI